MPVDRETGENPTSAGSVFQGLGSRLRRALTGDNEQPDTTLESELSTARFFASSAASRALTATDYRQSAERIRSDLAAGKNRLEEAIERAERGVGASPNLQRELEMSLFSLARIHEELGDFDEAESIYARICPIPSRHVSLPNHGHSSQVRHDLKEHEVETAVAYLLFLAIAGRNSTVALRLGERLMQQPRGFGTIEDRLRVTLCLLRIYIDRKDYPAALSMLNEVNAQCSPALCRIEFLVGLSIARANTAAAADATRSKSLFLHALVNSAVVLGMWTPQTLEVLHQYGTALKSWGDWKGASCILAECYLGRRYRRGESHPASKRTFTELEECGRHQMHLVTQQIVDRGATGKELNLSRAYEHIYLNSVIDLLVTAGETSFEEVDSILQALLDEKGLKVSTGEHRAVYTLRIYRTLARSKLQQGKVADALALLEEIPLSIKRSSEGVLQSNLDLAICYAKDSSKKDKACELSRSVFFDAEEEIGRDGAAAFQRKLAQLNLTHFTYSTLINNPLPIKVLDSVGTGAYAVVEGIEISGRTYARKSISLPRYNQRRLRETIENEISVIRTLTHPHIVQVYFTYEEKTRFAIVLEPLASCDLEAFLERLEEPDNRPPAYGDLLFSWFGCLASTLAFIHSKGIRHKDIKTRNILVKDLNIIFADFGSSHAFLDEGTSTTDGPAFGHTVMYCAPEVIASAKRSRSADVFSLGCVFTEMATILDGRRVSEYFEFRAKESEIASGRETHAYHATLDLVDEWFEDATGMAKALYASFIQPMITRDPESRPTALDVYDTHKALYGEDILCGEDIFKPPATPCSKCVPLSK